MNGLLRNISFFVFGLLLSTSSYAQEKEKINVEQSSEVFLEEYTDEFQETFFEALKQKGIQNYDRAANLLLECKRLQPDNVVIDHELAKTYMLDKRNVFAQQYAIEALVAEPENYWYLDTLVAILEKQSNDIETIRTTIPYEKKELQKNLALIYYKRRKYNAALAVLKELSKSDFKEELTLKIQDSLTKVVETTTSKSTEVVYINSRKYYHV